MKCSRKNHLMSLDMDILKEIDQNNLNTIVTKKKYNYQSRQIIIDCKNMVTLIKNNKYQVICQIEKREINGTWARN